MKRTFKFSKKDIFYSFIGFEKMVKDGDMTKKRFEEIVILILTKYSPHIPIHHPLFDYKMKYVGD